ncbi:hypothetical protein JXB02_03575 [Candidatus Woesearchaeota archaeon]|nr:hypothetical protein [Candidatus Woesearchaeota archaeon]
MTFPKRLLLAALLLGLVVLAAGCTGGFPFAEKREAGLSSYNFRTGTFGLTMEFLKGSPPAYIFEDTPFDLSIKLQNLGAYEITDGVIVLGLEDDYVSRTGSEPTAIEIRGKSISEPYGEVQIRTYGLRSDYVDDYSETHHSVIMATACYRYRTEASPTVCIDTDVYNLRPGPKPCSASTLTFAGQGAPVAVTQVEQQMVPSGDYLIPQFIITVENKGGGTIIDPYRVSEICSSTGTTVEDWNTIYLEAFMGDRLLDCRPNPLRMRSGLDTIRCYYQQGFPKEDPTYSTTLDLRLDYGYSFTVSQGMTIEKAGIR